MKPLTVGLVAAGVGVAIYVLVKQRRAAAPAASAPTSTEIRAQCQEAQRLRVLHLDPDFRNWEYATNWLQNLDRQLQQLRDPAVPVATCVLTFHSLAADAARFEPPRVTKGSAAEISKVVQAANALRAYAGRELPAITYQAA
jgi:hypothetical protein